MSRKSKRFLELCLSGAVGPERIDEYVATWHASKDTGSLAEYLGFTEEEYACWLEDPSTLRSIMYARVHGLALKDVLDRGCTRDIAARAR